MLSLEMIINLRLLTGEIKKIDVGDIEGLFVHKGIIITRLNKVRDGDWLLEVPKTNCSW